VLLLNLLTTVLFPFLIEVSNRLEAELVPLTDNLSSVVLARHTSNIMEMYYDRDFAAVQAEKAAALVVQT
jgi:hypothetical protein